MRKVYWIPETKISRLSITINENYCEVVLDSGDQNLLVVHHYHRLLSVLRKYSDFL